MTKRTQSEVRTDATTYLADNTSRDISAEDVRDRVTDIADSVHFSTGVTAYAVNLMDFIPEAEHAAIQAWTPGGTESTYDVWQSMVDAIAALPYIGGTIFVPPGLYRFGQTIDLQKPVHLAASGRSGMGTWTSVVFRFYDDTTTPGSIYNIDGLVICGDSSTLRTTRASGSGGGGSVIEKITFWGKKDGDTYYPSHPDLLASITGDPARGITVRSRAIIRGCYVRDFPGDGIYGNNASQGGAESVGNANGTIIDSCLISQNGWNGVYFDGPDMNAGTVQNTNSEWNGRWGFWDASFLGNKWSNNQTEGNKWGAAYTDSANCKDTVFFGFYQEGAERVEVNAPAIMVGGLAALENVGTGLTIDSNGLSDFNIGAAWAAISYDGDKIDFLADEDSSTGLRFGLDTDRAAWTWLSNAVLSGGFTNSPTAMKFGRAEPVTYGTPFFNKGLGFGSSEANLRMWSSASAAPTGNGTYRAGEIRFNHEPAKGEPAMWVCTTTGYATTAWSAESNLYGRVGLGPLSYSSLIDRTNGSYTYRLHWDDSHIVAIGDVDTTSGSYEVVVTLAGCEAAGFTVGKQVRLVQAGASSFSIGGLTFYEDQTFEITAGTAGTFTIRHPGRVSGTSLLSASGTAASTVATLATLVHVLEPGDVTSVGSADVVISAGNLSTTSGSRTVTVISPAHALEAGDKVHFDTTTSVGGLQLCGAAWSVLSSGLTADVFKFTHPDTASSDAVSAGDIDAVFIDASYADQTVTVAETAHGLSTGNVIMFVPEDVGGIRFGENATTGVSAIIDADTFELTINGGLEAKRTTANATTIDAWKVGQCFGGDLSVTNGDATVKVIDNTSLFYKNVPRVGDHIVRANSFFLGGLDMKGRWEIATVDGDPADDLTIATGDISVESGSARVTVKLVNHNFQIDTHYGPRIRLSALTVGGLDMDARDVWIVDRIHDTENFSFLHSSEASSTAVSAGTCTLRKITWCTFEHTSPATATQTSLDDAQGLMNLFTVRQWAPGALVTEANSRVLTVTDAAHGLTDDMALTIGGCIIADDELKSAKDYGGASVTTATYPVTSTGADSFTFENTSTPDASTINMGRLAYLNGMKATAADAPVHSSGFAKGGTDLQVWEYLAPSTYVWSTAAQIPLEATATVDPASVASGAVTATDTITVTGAALGDIVRASFDKNLSGLHLNAYVSATNTVAFNFLNLTAGAVDLASGTLKVQVVKS
jgi:hypothetical protein